MEQTLERNLITKIRVTSLVVRGYAERFPLQCIGLHCLEACEYADYICSDVYAVSRNNLAVILKSNLPSLRVGSVMKVGDLVDMLNS